MSMGFARGFFPAVSTVMVLAMSLAPAEAQKSLVDKSKNMDLVGYNDLQARSAYQPIVHRQGNRWIAYVGHHGGSALNPLTGVVEGNGTSIIDVTDPQNPVYLHHIPGASGAGEAGGAQMVRACNGSDLPAGNPTRVYLLRTRGNDAHEIYDVTDPAAPTLLTTIVDGLGGTHKNFWECDTGIAYLVSGVAGWRTNRMTQIYDLSNPASPVHIRDYGLVGQEPGSSGPVPTSLHGGISIGQRVYFGHGTNAGGILQIADRQKLLQSLPPTAPNLAEPVIAQYELSPLYGAHTTFPVLGIPLPGDEFTVGGTRDIVVIVNESLRNECIGEAHQMVFLADVTVESHPQIISNFQVPESEGNYCQKGGRFGAHSSNENMTPIYYRRLVFIAYFNAGVRAVDIRDPFRPEEVGYFIPAVTDKTDERCVTLGGVETCKVAIQTNNVDVDDRGYVYIVDRANTGMHILKVTGRARRIANFD
jgi:hypothetical protein